MRLGVVANLTKEPDTAVAEFAKANSYLEDVVNRIRPNYGFALWELGRVSRVAGHFGDAIVWLEKALLIPDDERNVCVDDVRAEIETAQLGSDLFC